jgi:hypothetical protein
MDIRRVASFSVAFVSAYLARTAVHHGVLVYILHGEQLAIGEPQASDSGCVSMDNFSTASPKVI